jgi:hypothetical protein
MGLFPSKDGIYSPIGVINHMVNHVRHTPITYMKSQKYQVNTV